MIKDFIKKKTFINCLLILCSAIVLATVLLIAIYSIPTDRAQHNIMKSVDLYSENVIKSWTGNSRHAKLATSTDSNMISSAICRPFESIIDNALLNPQYELNSLEEDPQRHALVLALDGKMDTYSTYGRYWHGYSIYMISGLYFFDLGELRTINMFIVFVMSMMVLYEFSKIDIVYSMLYVLVILFLNPVTIIMNFALLSMYLIASLILYVQLRYRDRLSDEQYIYLFLISGILTSFFDFLTYPLISWGLPLITYLLTNKKRDNGKRFVQLIRISLAWVMGYVGMWAGKWVVASILTDENIILDAVKALMYRTTNNDIKISYLSTLRRLFEVFDRPMLLLLLSGLIIVASHIIRNKKSFSLNKDSIFNCVIMFLMFLSPLVWFFIVRNHSYYHPWYEYRHIAIMLWSGFVLLLTPFK